MTQAQTVAEESLLVSLTLHNFSAQMLREFAVKIMEPYFGGNLNEAMRKLMEQAIEEEKLVNQAIRKRP